MNWRVLVIDKISNKPVGVYAWGLTEEQADRICESWGWSYCDESGHSYWLEPEEYVFGVEDFKYTCGRFDLKLFTDELFRRAVESAINSIMHTIQWNDRLSLIVFDGFIKISDRATINKYAVIE